MYPITALSPYTSLIGFFIGLPTLSATYYQAWRTRKETNEAREGFVYSANCLDFIREDGSSINLVPLETLHTLPKAGDIVLLPGTGLHDPEAPQHAAYVVQRIEYVYTRVENNLAAHGQARLAQAVAHVTRLSSE